MATIFTLFLCPTPGCWVSEKIAVYTSGSLAFCGCDPKNTSLDSLPEWPVGLVFLGSVRQYQTKKQLLTGCHPGLSAEGPDRNAHLQSFPERGIFAYFTTCCLKVWLPISLNLGADWEPSLWDTNRSWHSLNLCELLRIKYVAWTITMVWEISKS